MNRIQVIILFGVFTIQQTGRVVEHLKLISNIGPRLESSGEGCTSITSTPVRNLISFEGLRRVERKSLKRRNLISEYKDVRNSR